MTTAVDDVASYFVEHCDYVDPMKLQKLLYFAQAWHLAILDEPLLDEHFEAWRDGPVIDAVYQVAKPARWRELKAWSGNSSLVAATSKAIVDAVISQYGAMSAGALSDLTHEDGPWKSVRGTLPPTARSRRRIPERLLVKHFRQNEKLLGRSAVDIASGGSEEFDLFAAPEPAPSVAASESKAGPLIGRGQFEVPRRRRPRAALATDG